MKKLNLCISVLFLAGCAAAPSKMIVSQNYISGQAQTDKAEKIEKALTLGVNQLTAGYSAEVTLYTEPLLIARATEKGKMNMESDQKIQSEIKKDVDALIKGQTCFMFSVHTYSIHRAMFKNWVAKVKDFSNILKEIEFFNRSGVESVPSTGKDINGRDWHNSSIGCTKNKIDTTKPFTLFLIPQIKNNANEDETTVLTWEIK